jgi:hypothetical protein
MKGMEVPMRAAVIMVLAAVSASPALAQESVNIINPPPPLRSVNLSGPRFGFTSLSEGVVEKLHERNIDVGSTISQFGWQFEREFYSSKTGGLAALNEFIVLAGGLEQGVVLPSVTWMVGLRSPGGAEFGIGPNITPAGVALALAGGVTFRSGALNVPVTFAVVPSKVGTRVSMLTGFNMRGRR